MRYTLISSFDEDNLNNSNNMNVNRNYTRALPANQMANVATGDGAQYPPDENRILYDLCFDASDIMNYDESKWDHIRRWMDSNDRGKIMDGIRYINAEVNMTTALHAICEHNDPPIDIIRRMLDLYPLAAQVVDTDQQIPLTYACRKRAPADVIQLLIDTYPAGKTHKDLKGHTPLHVFLFKLNQERSVSIDNLVLIARILTRDVDYGFNRGNAAQEACHERGMLPLHFACLFDAPAKVVQVLLEAYPGAVTDYDVRGYTPLHYSMTRSHVRGSPDRVKLLIGTDTNVANKTNSDGTLPLHSLELASRASNLGEGQENVIKCLKIYLDAKPRPNADFLTGLQKLPVWLKNKAVVNDYVKIMLNEKIAKRFPTMILILDGYFLIATMALFVIASESYLENFDEDATKCEDLGDKETRDAMSIFLFFGSAYFLARELLQMLSLYSLGSFKSWLNDVTNWLDVVLIGLVFTFTSAMGNCMIDKNIFRMGTVLTILVITAKIISFLKSSLVEFAVFVNGVLYVVKRLGTFLVALFIVLMAFSQIFFFIYKLSDECAEDPDFSHCTLDKSLLKVFASLMGEVDPTLYINKTEAICFFFFYVFLVIILLSNVLIAVVTDNYGIIKNERAAMVFWSNRLDYVAEMDAISSGPWKRRLRAILTFSDAGSSSLNITEPKKEKPVDKQFDYVVWNNFVHPRSGIDESMSLLNIEFWVLSIWKGFVFIVVIPMWVLLGIFSAGWLWPPQIREWMLVQPVSSSKTRADLSNVVAKQIRDLREEVGKLRAEVEIEMKSDRKEIISMKAESGAVQETMLVEMMQIKEIMETLLVLRRNEA